MTDLIALVSGAIAGALAFTSSASATPPATEPATEPTAATGRQSGPWDLVLTDVRVGHHDTVDRVVLEFEGSGVPGWRVEHVDKAVLDGSGHLVRLDGGTILQIGVTGTEWPGPDAGYYDGPDRVPAPAGGPLTEVYVGGTFEGYTKVFAGAEDSTRFEVHVLTAPPRLVVDVERAD
jgi:hypothetical protein